MSDHMLLPLSRGSQYARIDARDLFAVHPYTWHAAHERSGAYYAKTMMKRADGTAHSVALHRFLLGVTADRTPVRFLNGNTLDCTRANLVLGNHHARVGAAATSRFRGVSLTKGAKPWRAEIRIAGVHHFLGHHETEEEAADAYDAALLDAGGDARLTNRALAARREEVIGEAPLLPVSPLVATNTSGYRGVSKDPYSDQWRAIFTHQGETLFEGYHPSPIAAAHAYDRIATEYLGSAAILNFPATTRSKKQ